MCKTPHKHAEVIKAWADGAEIQVSLPGRTKWIDCRPSFPGWDVNLEYRIKPELKPDVIRYVHIKLLTKTQPHIHISCDSNWNYEGMPCYTAPCNARLIFDGETGKLKKVEMLGD